MTTAIPIPGHPLPGRHVAAEPDRWVFSDRQLLPGRPDSDAIVDSPELITVAYHRHARRLTDPPAALTPAHSGAEPR